MRALKITAFYLLLTAVVVAVMLAALMAWLVRSEQGSRWLLQQGLGVAPVTIEASGISGTLADGLAVDSLTIELPTAEIRAVDIVVSWSPASLLTGTVDINHAHIAELGIDLLETESSAEPIEDKLFWLQIPLHIYIESGELDKLRIEKAEFDKLSLSGSIGHGRLDIETLAAQIAGIELQASGGLVGPEPGQLQAIASWEMPAENLKGSGSFKGDIDKLGFTQVINVPEAVNFNGTIHDLFTAPSLTGVATWPSLRLPGETVLISNAGNIRVSSDFRSARLEGSSNMLLEGWPQVPLQLDALVDLQGITIDRYTIDALDGSVTGSGRIDYSDGLQGQLAINAEQIDTGLINHELPGRLGFNAALKIESAHVFAIDVSAANAKIAEKDLNGVGRAHWRDAKLSAIDATINAATNRLSADIKLGKQLAGSINAHAPELAMLWPGLQGALDASVTLGGSHEKPQLHVAAKATAVSFGTQALETLALTAELKGDNTVAGKIAATGLTSGDQQLGDLDYSQAGTLAKHQSSLNLSGGVVNVELRASGGWDGEYLSQRFDYGRIQPDGFDSWQLQQKPELRMSAAAGQLSAHCWTQRDAGICIDASNWDANSLKSVVVINDFALATLQPLLAEGYSIDGKVNADLKLVRNSAGLQGELHWRQSRTLLGYADDIDKFQTVLDEVRIDLVTDNTQTSLDANLSGEQGLNMTATTKVIGPLVAGSTLQASANGRLPDIGLLRPLVQRALHPGELEGELTVALDVGGTLGDPLFTGGANLADGLLGLVGAGVTLSGINIAAQSVGTDKLQLTGELRSGDGRAEILGEIRAAENTNLVADISIRGQNLATVRVPDLSVDTSPDLKLHIGEDVFDISGTLLIAHATAEIRALPQSAVPRSADVIVHAPEGVVEQQQGTIVTGNVEVVLGDDVRFSGFGLTSRLDGGLRLTQSRGGYLRSGGTVRVRDGFLTGYGRELRVDRGELTFTGPMDDPLINIQVSRESIYEGRQYTIGLRLTGTAQNVRTEPFSRPAMSERDVLSFLLLDRPATSDSDASGAALALGLQQLLPDQSGRFGLDEVSFETNDANQAAMVAGKRINDKVYVRYVFGSLGTPGSFRIRYTLGRGFSLEASTGARQSMDLIYLLDR
jgi:translocation and assembly module TamB